MASNAASIAKTEHDYQGGYPADSIPETGGGQAPGGGYGHASDRRRTRDWLPVIGARRLDHDEWHRQLIAELYADSGDPS